MNLDPNLLALARAAAACHALDPALVCSIVEQESAWNSFAMRYEPAFRARYVGPLGLVITEEVSRSISWGLMQVMGQVAREHGFDGKFLSALCQPLAGLECGCLVLAAKIEVAAHEFASAGGIAPASPAVSGSTGQGIAPPEIACTLSNARESGAQAIAAGMQKTGPSAQNNSTEFPERRILARALALWNGGADPAYPEAVFARMSRYQ